MNEPNPAAAVQAQAPGPWYVKTPGARPDQASIVIDQAQVINRQGKDFVLYAGLLAAAHNAGLQGIHTTIVQCPSPHNDQTAIVHATAEFPWGSYTGIGDANPENTSRNIVVHRIRMAETRAKARALRDALNVGMVAYEEIGGPDPGEPKAEPAKPNFNPPAGNSSYRTDPDKGNAAPRPVGERKTYGTPLTKPAVQ